jgi:hypothetical protein
VLRIMLDRMLTRDRETFCTGFPNSGLLEDRTIIVEAIQSVLDGCKGGFAYNVAPNQVTEIYVRRQGTNNFSRNMAFDCSEVNLKTMIVLQ